MVWLKRFVLSIQFLTRFPIPLQLDVKNEDFAKCMMFFPLVGLIVGGFLLAGFYLAALLNLSFMVPVIFAVLLEVLISGALHVDGLADTCDGLFSNKNRQRMLEIMKDSRIGTNGSIAIFFDLSVKFFLLADIYQKGGVPSMIYVLLSMPLIGRTAMVAAAGISRYARKEGGLGQVFFEGASPVDRIITCLVGLVLLWLIMGGQAVVHFSFAILVSLLLTKSFENKLGGLTGDTFGAINEAAEILFLLSYLLMRGLYL